MKVLAEMKTFLMPVIKAFTASVGIVFNVTVFLYRFVIITTRAF